MRIYDEEHSIQSLLDASNEMDADVANLASVPVRTNGPDFAQNNILGERFYNFHAVNEQLATMDVNAVRDNKRRYTLVYQVKPLLLDKYSLRFVSSKLIGIMIMFMKSNKKRKFSFH